MEEESDEVPLLRRDDVEGTFKVLHQVWACDQNEDQESDFEEDTYVPRASSVKSTLSQAPEMECSESLSQILSQVSEPSEERRKLTRVEAYTLLREATNAADAAQRALEHICGEDFKDATGEELEARDNLVRKVQRNLLKLQKARVVIGLMCQHKAYYLGCRVFCRGWGKQKIDIFTLQYAFGIFRLIWINPFCVIAFVSF